jgi:hypothetical protein
MAFGDAKRDHVSDLPGSVVIEDQIVGLSVGEQGVDDPPLNGIGALFGPLGFGSDVGLRPVPGLDCKFACNNDPLKGLFASNTDPL